ncbi:MAG TPA: four-helix bundle copper-binding protein [Devosiaceae bacterium]|nr:four-helix bundle copper-binding protein [Devosiaceae bacterium]
MHTQEMIATHPQVQGSTNDILIQAIEGLADCALTCSSCADACLGEPNVAELTQCIRLDLDCADVCAATSTCATRRTGSNEALIKAMLELSADQCEVCAEECEQFASSLEHCRICADTCRECGQTARQAAASIIPGSGVH